MSSKNSALASLTAQYTDSENEDDRDSDEDNSPNTDSSESQVILIQPKTATPTKQQTESSGGKSLSNKALRLVSYNDDNAVSDDENVSPNREAINMDISEEDTDEENSSNGTGGSSSVINGTTVNADVAKDNKTTKTDKFAEFGFSLPPEPKGKCSHELQDKITNMYDKMKSGMDMNRVIQDRKEFRNPSIYEKLIQFCDIDELGTNYPPEIYDPLQWGKESFYEELARIQKVEMEKRDRDRKDNIKQELVIAAAKKAEEEAKRRKSKWDQPAPGIISSTGTATAAQLVQATFTTNATGTKGTVISAFGSLPKKPKI